MTIVLNCKNCLCEFTVQFKHRTRKFCSNTCCGLFFKGPNNPAYGKVYRTKKTHPEWAQQIQESHKKNTDNVERMISGNPMKDADVAKRVSESRKKMFEENSGLRDDISKSVCDSWRMGKYDNVKVGRCKWYEFIKSDGTKCKVQGKWELKYAEWLDHNNVRFIAHRGAIPYEVDGTKHVYMPDFYLIDDDVFIDVKNDYHYSLNVEKWSHIRRDNPNIKINILFKKDLESLGIKL